MKALLLKNRWLVKQLDMVYFLTTIGFMIVIAGLFLGMLLKA